MIKKSLVLGIKVYRLLGHALPLRTCRFHPSCSQYAMEAIEKHGVLAGIFKAAARIMRCSPLCEGGYDPV